MKINIFFSILMFTLIGSCTVIKVIDTTKDVAVGATKTTVKTTGAVVDVVVPDGKEKQKSD